MPKQVGKLSVLWSEIIIVKINDEDFINLTDIAKYKDPQRTDYIIQNRLRNRNTIEYLGLRESIHNSHFKPIEFDGFKKEAGSNSFVMTSKRRIDQTGAIGLVAKQWRYGWTYAHKDIAIKFASWISVEFELLNTSAIHQMKSLVEHRTTEKIERLDIS